MPHVQHWHDGKKLPSVTTISGRYGDPGGLMWWNNQLGLGTHSSLDHQTPCETCQRRPGMSSWEAKKLPAQIGTLAHALIDQAITGKDFDDSDFDHFSFEDRQKANQSLENYLRWRDSLHVEYIETETSLMSEKYLFGGTFDALAWFGTKKQGRRLALTDWKTSNGWYVNNLVQLGGYIILMEENDYDPLDEVHLLRVSKENCGFEHLVRSRKDFQIAVDYFHRSLKLYQLEKPMKDLAK